MTIFNRKNIPVCSTFLDVLGLAELSQGGYWIILLPHLRKL